MSIVTCRSHLSRGVPAFWDQQSRETLFSYVGGTTGPWQVTQATTRCGAILPIASHVRITTGQLDRVPAGTAWILSGVVSNSRYVAREEIDPFLLNGVSSGRSEASCAAIIPIRKSPEWWRLAHDERREIVAARRWHLSSGLKFLPAIARRLRHGRELGENFDFVTWFEYAPQDSSIFEEMLWALRASEEWQYVDREIDIRLIREPQN